MGFSRVNQRLYKLRLYATGLYLTEPSSMLGRLLFSIVVVTVTSSSLAAALLLHRRSGFRLSPDFAGGAAPGPARHGAGVGTRQVGSFMQLFSMKW